MAIVQELEGNSGSGAPASTTATLPAPTTAGTGRFLVIIVSCDATVPTPAGFTLDRSQVNNAAHYVFRKLAANGESSWIITPAVPAALAWWAAEISGLDASPLDRVQSAGTGSAGLTQSTGTTAVTTTDNQLAIASFSSSVGAGVALVTANSFSNGFTEIADTFTTRITGTDVGLAVATKDLVAAGTQECTVTWSSAVDRTGIMVTYKLSAVAPAEGEVDTPLDIAPALTGARASEGALAGALGLAPALTGSAPNGGAVHGTIGLEGALVAVRASEGALAGALGLAPALAGARASLGALAGTLALAPGLIAVRPSLGVLNTPLVISPALTGTDGQSGRPVRPYPFPDGPVSGFPWPPRPVKSFQEVTEP